MSGEENLAKAVSVWLLTEGCLSTPRDQANGFWDTPIERLFYQALMIGADIGITWLNLTRTTPSSNVEMQVRSQAKVGKWRVDYLITIISDANVASSLIVECDGHDFHERTKEQAKRDRERDREAQALGYTIYRFTGSELYADALKCARDVFRWAESAAWKTE